jgi:alkaline phosphatase D
LRALVTVDASADGFGSYTENLNLLLRDGLVSAGAFAQLSGPTRLAAALTQSINPNPHIRYIDTNAQGYGYVKVTGAQIEATLVTVERPVNAAKIRRAGIKRTASFTIPKDNPAGMSAATVTGEKPFPLT